MQLISCISSDVLVGTQEPEVWDDDNINLINKMMLESCLESLKNKNNEFNEALVRNKFNNRFILSFVIDLPKNGKYEFGFDNHLNHQRPHVHVRNKRNKYSFSIDQGELLHKIKNKKDNINNKELNEIKNWILERKDCLEFIYKNIQNCKDKDDFVRIINEL